MIYNWLNIIQSSCVLCQAITREASGLCDNCTRLLPELGHSCRQCANPLHASHSKLVCGDCLKQPPAFDRTISLYTYSHPVDYLITQCKFHARLSVARSLGQLLAEKLHGETDHIQALLPVPLHPRRLRQRGFNQAVEISKIVGKQFRLPILLHACVRNRYTDNQADLPLKARARNLKDAFTVTGKIPYQSIAIIDDVMTTGYTANALALCLKRSGVEHVSVFTISRTILDR